MYPKRMLISLGFPFEKRLFHYLFDNMTLVGPDQQDILGILFFEGVFVSDFLC